MLVRFWGVRGSLPAPQLPSQIRSKISAILERLTPADIESPESRERFLSTLPPWLFGAVGGNTPCVTLNLDSSPELLVFDAGTGIRELGNAVLQENSRPSQYRLFFSHLHWDHIHGLPFFGPAYDPSVTLDLYSPMKDLESALQGQMNPPYFPIHMEAMGCKKNFHVMDDKVILNGATVFSKKMNHPGDAYSFMVNDGKHRYIYDTDTELSAEDFLKNEENTRFFKNADLLVIDCQYTLGEAVEKYNWGHSAFSLAVD
jgi:phosphoribosyl 1,2-cyclic phosphodiesterase